MRAHDGNRDCNSSFLLPPRLLGSRSARLLQIIIIRIIIKMRRPVARSHTHTPQLECSRRAMGSERTRPLEASISIASWKLN